MAEGRPGLKNSQLLMVEGQILMPESRFSGAQRQSNMVLGLIRGYIVKQQSKMAEGQYASD